MGSRRDGRSASAQRRARARAADRAPENRFYGERSGTIRDPFSHRWNIGHHIEDVTPEEMQRRYTNVMKGA